MLQAGSGIPTVQIYSVRRPILRSQASVFLCVPPAGETDEFRKFLHLAVGLGVPHSGIGKFHVGILQNSPEVCGENQKNSPPSI